MTRYQGFEVVGSEILALESLMRYTNRFIEGKKVWRKESTIPAFYVENRHVIYLRLNHVFMQNIPPEIAEFSELRCLDVSFTRFQTCTDQLHLLKRLEEINLMGNDLQTIPDVLEYLPSLKVVNLTYNQIGLIPYWIRNLQNLRSLNLTNNHLTYFSENLLALPSLVSLYLGGNEIPTIPSTITNLKNLSYVDVSSCGLTRLPAEIVNTNISVLDISFNKFAEFPTVIFSISSLRNLIYGVSTPPAIIPFNLLTHTNLTGIAFKNCGLTEIPAQILACKNLQFLNLDHNQISTIPNELFTLTNLNFLSLAQNQIEHLPDGFQSFSKMTYLNLNSNPLTLPFPDLSGMRRLNTLNEIQLQRKTNVIPSIERRSLFDLFLLGKSDRAKIKYQINNSHVVYLEIGKNELSFLPNSIANFPNLRYLNLNDNKLTTLPSGIGELRDLVNLIVVGNELESLPDSIGRLENLTYMTLAYNKLRILPESFACLKHLYFLGLNNNELERLPQSIGNLNRLEFFNLDTNHLHSLPETLGECSMLKSLVLGRNCLQDLPLNLANLHNLETLILNDNPWLSFYHAYIVNQPLDQVLFNLTRLRNFIPVLIQKIVDNSPLDDFETQFPYYGQYTTLLELKCCQVNTDTAHEILMILQNNGKVALDEYGILL